MNETILFNLEIILIDFFTAYGLTTILLLILSIFIKNNFLKRINYHCSRFISLVGIVYLILWIIITTIEGYVADEESKSDLLKRTSGGYLFFYCLQPLLWFSITQILRFKVIRENILIRLIFSFFLIVSIERIVIIISSFHRDYLPSSWTMYSNSYSSNIFLESLMLISIFLIATRIFVFISKKINEWKIKKTNSQ